MEKLKRTLGFILQHPLSKRHVVNALGNFLFWQLQCSLFPNRLFIKPFLGPIRFYAKKGLTGITGNIYTGLHEFNDMAFLLHFLRPDDVFADVGANVGSYTLLAAGIGKASVIAIEPGAAAFDLLSKNIKLNNLESAVLPVNAIAGADSGEVRFTAGQDTTNHVATADDGLHNEPVLNMIAVDSLVNGQCPALMKIDVEGYETEVLKGMTKALKNRQLKAIIIELNGSSGRYGYNDEDIHQNLLTHGFLPFDYDPFARKLKRKPTFNDYNTIYCRDLAFTESRLAGAQAIKVFGEEI